MCCDFLSLYIHAMLIYIVFIYVSSGKVEGEGLYKWRVFCESYTILALLSFIETFDSGAPFYGASVGTEIGTKFISIWIVMYCH